MSLLNLTNDGLPNVLVVLYATVARARAPITNDELLEEVAPPNLTAEGGKMARQTLNRWTELGLFSLQGKNVTLSSAPESDLRTDAELVASVRKASRMRALAAENNVDLWAQESARAADLTRSLAWLLAQDVYRTGFKDLEQREQEQMVDQTRRLMQNDTRRNGLQFWSHFLGFVRQPGGGDIDPTVAVRDVLPQCLQRGEDMPAEAFVARVAELLPVLDGGQWRRAVEAQVRPEALPELAPGQVSSSLSRALQCLVLAQELILEPRADTGSSIVLTGQGGLRGDLRFHWVRRPGKEKLQ
jgi:hypothetical protein